MALVFTKPISRWGLWMGRWMGTSIPFVAVMGVLYAILLTRDFPEGLHRLQPQFEPIEKVAYAELEKMRQEGLDTAQIEASQGVTEERLLKDIRRQIVRRYTELTSETPLVYTFSPLPKETSEVFFCLSGVPFMGAYNSNMMTLEATYGADMAILPIEITKRGVEARLPTHWEYDGAQAVTVKIIRKASFDEAGYILFKEREDIQLFYSGYPPQVNLLFAVVVMAGVVLMASALGCTLGAFFSLPVGLFVGSFCLIAAAVASVNKAVTVRQELENIWLFIGTRISDVVAGPFRGIVELNPLTRLSSGIAIEGAEVGAFFLFSLLPWILICSVSVFLTSLKDEER
jgi:hypothetical protein